MITGTRTDAHHPDCEPHISRRAFLQVGTAAGGGLLLSLGLTWREARGGASATDIFAPNAFIRIDRESRVTLIISQVEMGQGTYTSMPMLIAEELEVELDDVHLEALLPMTNSTAIRFWVTRNRPAARLPYGATGNRFGAPARLHE
ncbi:MAG: molybdopterin cofactor-binding domain-containing protein [Bryobacteraceae bacterium]